MKNSLKIIPFVVLGFCLGVSQCTPVSKKYTVRPEIKVQILNQASQKPIPQATVWIHHFVQPHSFYQQSWTQQSDEAGWVSFAEMTEVRKVYPLMLHGVPEYYWNYCIEAKGFASKEFAKDYENQLSETIFLEPSQTPSTCKKPK